MDNVPIPTIASQIAFGEICRKRSTERRRRFGSEKYHDVYCFKLNAKMC